MDGIANVDRQQQSQASTVEAQGRAVEQSQQSNPSVAEVAQQMTKEAENNGTKINSKKDVTDLVNQLNKAMAPINPDLKFGVDSQNIFFVSVIDQKTDKIIRRFPAEQAENFLPKMQEVTGILFDHKG